MDQEALLSTAYAGPVYYYGLLAKFDDVFIELHENFPKQTIRNRCEIYGANGKMTLSIPVIRGRTHKVSIKDLKISYDIDWQKQHFKSIESAYRHSPFYDYYIDIIHELFFRKYQFLCDLNLFLTEKINDAIDLNVNLKITDKFINPVDNEQDFRYSKPGNNFINNLPIKFPEYYQVFSDRHGFISNLSILDLLFNEGPNSLDYLITVINN